MTDRQKEYSKYLKSDDWKKRRKELSEAWGNECAACNTTENLHIHHMNYENLGKESPLDVVLLCKGCHLSFHKKRLKIWIFTQEEYEAFQKIKNIIYDGGYSYITFIKS